MLVPACLGHACAAAGLTLMALNQRRCCLWEALTELLTLQACVQVLILYDLSLLPSYGSTALPGALALYKSRTVSLSCFDLAVAEVTGFEVQRADGGGSFLMPRSTIRHCELAVM